MTRVDAFVLIAYYLALGILAIYSIHRLYLVRLRRRHDAPLPLPTLPAIWPSVTVQLPLFNEPNVAERLIDAVASIEYDGRFDIQVLDDSTDITPSIVAGRVAHWRERGVTIEHIRRTSRDGFKAGALAHGMAMSDSDLFAVFDADFVPPPDILALMVPHFGRVEDRHSCLSSSSEEERTTRIGMVQARWTHLNRDASLLTRVQAIYLDGHFAVESAARHSGGRFFNFNGTAGIWRREAIEEAGGWSASTLTEDLDLSYRAQLAGWKFVFLPDVEVPAELPAALSGFQEQQHRWAKGSIQTARKLLPRIIGGDLSPAIKSEAFFHLTNNSAYLLTLVIALLIVPAIVIRQRLGILWTMLIDVALFILSTGSVLLFYIEGQRRARRAISGRELLAVIPIGVGISLRNSAAVLEGLIDRGGHFRRTPKSGDSGELIAERAPRLPVAEVIMAVFFIGAFACFLSAKQWAALPFLTLFLGGFVYVAAAAVHECAGWAFRLHLHK
jgi:cellulose synthase/poly-beta-1,6-N-acetylglucosamine synthase-like glycosyltransferase